ncbi:MAG: CDP-alcohol phosphatidyltransferase family protein, partial [Hyphomicrobiaceae bacterium]|nr:CDP-alcohol phosphatidyltransferase family protein [Hyphomicrobiaceae bacterium]
LMLACEFSDFLDGHIARAYQQVSSVGKILDPMADSLYHVCIFVAFVELGWMPLWALLIIASRDIAVSYLRLLAEQSTGTLAARRSGKLKTAAYSVAQIGAVALFAILGPAGFASILPFVSALLLGLTALAAYTLVEYSLVVLRRLA